MTLAHIAGVPIEEWIAPIAVSGSGIAVALEAVLRQRRRPPSSTVA